MRLRLNLNQTDDDRKPIQALFFNLLMAVIAITAIPVVLVWNTRKAAPTGTILLVCFMIIMLATVVGVMLFHAMRCLIECCEVYDPSDRDQEKAKQYSRASR